MAMHMTTSCFVVLVDGDRAPAVLGPMSAEVRTQHIEELSQRYGPGVGLHTLDVEADGPSRVSVTINRYEPKGERPR